MVKVPYRKKKIVSVLAWLITEIISTKAFYSIFSFKELKATYKLLIKGESS